MNEKTLIALLVLIYSVVAYMLGLGMELVFKFVGMTNHYVIVGVYTLLGLSSGLCLMSNIIELAKKGV